MKLIHAISCVPVWLTSIGQVACDARTDSEQGYSAFHEKASNSKGCGAQYVGIEIRDTANAPMVQGVLAFVDPHTEENAYRIAQDSKRTLSVREDGVVCFHRDSVFDLYERDSLIAFWCDGRLRLKSFWVTRGMTELSVRVEE